MGENGFTARKRTLSKGPGMGGMRGDYPLLERTYLLRIGRKAAWRSRLQKELLSGLYKIAH